MCAVDCGALHSMDIYSHFLFILFVIAAHQRIDIRHNITRRIDTNQKAASGACQLGKWYWILNVVHCHVRWPRQRMQSFISIPLYCPVCFVVFFLIENCWFFGGQVWRFPFTALENGGGAFLIPYLIVLSIIGRPLYYMEMVIGQFSSRGSIKVYDMVPALRGELSLWHLRSKCN